jgi:hypothetical protein
VAKPAYGKLASFAGTIKGIEVFAQKHSGPALKITPAKSLLFKKNFFALRHCEAIERSPLFRKTLSLYVIAKR